VLDRERRGHEAELLAHRRFQNGGWEWVQQKAGMQGSVCRSLKD
jgi:hypothetical protein